MKTQQARPGNQGGPALATPTLPLPGQTLENPESGGWALPRRWFSPPAKPAKPGKPAPPARRIDLFYFATWGYQAALAGRPNIPLERRGRKVWQWEEVREAWQEGWETGREALRDQARLRHGGWE